MDKKTGCHHTVTKNNICVSCGEQIYDVETRPCEECKHYKKLVDGSICRLHLMAVIPKMLVTYKLKDGSCFKNH